MYKNVRYISRNLTENLPSESTLADQTAENFSSCLCGLIHQHYNTEWKLDLRKSLDLRKIVAVTDFLVHKLFDLRYIF
jgi:hypothetical protein